MASLEAQSSVPAWGKQQTSGLANNVKGDLGISEE
jgi:hypothetical protein